MASPVVRVVKGRNATVALAVDARLLFHPGGQIANWHRRFSNIATFETAQAAPVNKRPRWGYQGEPLKKSFTSSTLADMSQMRVHSIVGSRAPHSLYVDQGTNPFQAKILPPWAERGYKFFEHTWIPPGSSRPVGTKLVRGQRAQKFFEKGLTRAFHRMGMLGPEVPETPKMARALSRQPAVLTNVLVHRSQGEEFEAQLRVWRSERDAMIRERSLPYQKLERKVRSGFPRRRLTAEERRAQSAARSRRYRARKRELTKYTREKKQRQLRGYESLKAKKDAAVREFLSRPGNKGYKIVDRTPGGLVVIPPGSKTKFHIPWSRLYQML